ncbi:MAG: phosphoribosylanthranilate isomerase [Flavobacteriaceae bacterium]
MRLKVCGMKYNFTDVASLSPDYLGFIFWERSSRYFEGSIPALPPSIKKVGVFVNAPIGEVLENVSKYGLDAVQLHGKESADYCHTLKAKRAASTFELIKAFSIKDEFDFTLLEPYEPICDHYLFDTKGKLPGGNGHAFDWNVLRDYPYPRPYFLGGAI